MYFTNSLTRWPQRQMLWWESVYRNHVIVRSIMLAADSFIDDVTIGQQLFTFWDDGEWWQSHIYDRCSEYAKPEMFGRCFERSARHLGYRSDNGYFSQLWYRYLKNSYTEYHVQTQTQRNIWMILFHIYPSHNITGINTIKLSMVYIIIVEENLISRSQTLLYKLGSTDYQYYFFYFSDRAEDYATQFCTCCIDYI